MNYASLPLKRSIGTKGSEVAMLRPEAKQWPSVGFETLPWHHDPEALAGISKTARRRIGSTYRAAVPFEIASRPLKIDETVAHRLAEVSVELARFDAEQKNRGYDLPALLLRSESAASSQIENLTSSARNIALAEVSADAPRNAQMIVGNINAMRQALLSADDISLAEIKRIHSVLMNRGGFSSGGVVRQEQVWVGGYPYSPHGALFVPPQASRVDGCLDDFIRFTKRTDIGAIEKAAIAHAQFETIHPFIDGNGRTGRTLLHRILRSERVLAISTLPVSAGLLHNIDSYMDAISEYQQGNPLAVVNQVIDALELAVAIGSMVALRIDEIVQEWKSDITERSGAKIHDLPNTLIAQPVVDSKYLAETLSIARRAATSLIDRACEYGMLRPMGNRRRGEFYQSDDIIDLLDDISSVEGIRRIFSSGAK